MSPRPHTFCGIDLALKQGSQALAEEIAALINSLSFEAIVPETVLPEAVAEQVSAVQRRLELLKRRTAGDDAMRELLEELKQLLAEYTPDAATWEALRTDLASAYDALTSILTADDPEKPARPVNYARSLLHVGAAGFSLILLAVVPSQWLFVMAGGFALWAWSAEIARRVSPRANTVLMRFFGPVAHPSERHRVNSATWYATALTGLAATGSLTLMAVAVAVLGVGDPAAGLVGRRYGRTRLVHGRSLEGTLAGAFAGALAAFAMLTGLRPELSVGAQVVLATVAGVAGAVAELLSRRVDDNLSIPWASAVATSVAMMAMGIAL